MSKYPVPLSWARRDKCKNPARNSIKAMLKVLFYLLSMYLSTYLSVYYCVCMICVYKDVCEYRYTCGKDHV